MECRQTNLCRCIFSLYTWTNSGFSEQPFANYLFILGLQLHERIVAKYFCQPGLKNKYVNQGMFRICFALLTLCLWTSLAIAQITHVKGDNDMENAKAGDAFALAAKNSDSAMLLANEVLVSADKSGNKRAFANAQNAIGWAFMHKGQFDSSIIFLKKAYAGFLNIKSEPDVICVDMNLAEVYTKQNQLANAISYLMEGDSICLKTKNTLLHTGVKRQLAIVYRESGDTKKSAEYFNEALAGFEQQKDYYGYVNTAVSLSILYRNMNLPDSSLFVLNKSLEISKEKNDLPYQVAMTNENMGETYFFINNYPEALKHYIAAYETFIQINNRADQAYEAFCIGKTYEKLNQFENAEKYLMESYNTNDSLKMINYQLDASNELASLYKTKGDWENAYHFLQKASELSDTLNLSDQIEKTNELKAKFEDEKKEQEIALLKTKSQITKWWYLSSLFAVLIASLLIWLYQSRRKIHEQKILNYFATSLYNQNTVDDVFWDIAKNCVSQLKFEDCVIYGFDEVRNMLIQKAAFGPKNPEGHIISNLLEIPVGKGIVGAVAASMKPEIIKDTRKDSRYLVDDKSRNSEIAVPIVVDGKLLGVIDSEHSATGFFTKRHLEILQKIADTCAKKLTRNFVEEGLRKKIARDLHDDMGSTLSSINIISKVALQQSNIEGHLKNQLTSIKDYSLNMMESMGDMVWAINPENDTVESLLAKMKEWAAEICEPREVQLHFETPAEFEHIKLDTEKRKHLFLIFKEAVNNAIKYSQCKNIYVKMSVPEAAKIQLSVADDGIGFDMRHQKKGNGLGNMSARAGQLQAGINIISALGKGTIIEVKSIML